MSFRLGMILPQKIKCSIVNDIRKTYDLGLIPVENSNLCQQLTHEEGFYQVSKTGFDDLSGIGAFYYFNLDINQIYNNFVDCIEDTRIIESILSEYKERREGYRSDACRWISILNDFKNNYHINFVGLFWHMYSTSFEEEKFDILERRNYCLSQLSFEDLMKIPENVLVFFD